MVWLLLNFTHGDKDANSLLHLEDSMQCGLMAEHLIS